MESVINLISINGQNHLSENVAKNTHIPIEYVI